MTGSLQTTDTRPHAIVLWTGGKDSALALNEAKKYFNIVGLATFAPEPANFIAHPMALIRAQAHVLALPHQILRVGENYREGYIQGLKQLAASGAQVVITGDIDRVDGHPNWIREVASNIIDVEFPLWNCKRQTILDMLLQRGFRTVVSLAWDKYFANTIAGRELDAVLCRELIAAVSRGIDPCGENGEYHTCVLESPDFCQALHLYNCDIKKGPGYHHLTWSHLRPAPDAKDQGCAD